MGIGMGFAAAAAVMTGKPVTAIGGDSAFGFSGMEVETVCRCNLPVCIVVFDNFGVCRGAAVKPRGRNVAPTGFLKNARYGRAIEAFGGVGVHATTPGELQAAISDGLRSGIPARINAVIDENAGTGSGRIGSPNPQSAVRIPAAR